MEVQSYINDLTRWAKATTSTTSTYNNNFKAANPDLTMCRSHYVLIERQPMEQSDSYIDSKETGGRCGCLYKKDIDSILPPYDRSMSMQTLYEKWDEARIVLRSNTPGDNKRYEAAFKNERQAWLAYDMCAFVTSQRIRELMKLEPKDVREPANWNNPEDMSEEITNLQQPLFDFMNAKKLRTANARCCFAYCMQHDNYGDGYPVRHVSGYDDCGRCVLVEPRSALELETIAKLQAKETPLDI
jgi:hypothetical protein